MNKIKSAQLNHPAITETIDIYNPIYRFKNCGISLVRGYTFVEVLITTLIFSIVVLSIYSVFQTGSITYEKMDSAFDLYQQARIIFNRMDTDLKNSIVYGKNNAKFSGTSDEIVFCTVLDSFDNAGGIFKKVSGIKYEFQDSTLRRTQVDGLDILRRDVPGITEDLASDLEDISFQFAIYDADGTENHYAWQDIWPKKINDQDIKQQNSLPLAVKVEMVLGGVKFIKIIPLVQSNF
jgi:prepilin-type N-terminal cleavage/methylation domain-containing protein